jgi:hypothetical protein
VIVDDITCVKLISHTIDVIVAAYPDKAPDAEKRQKTIDACEERYKASPPTENDRQESRCGMAATTVPALQACVTKGAATP